MVRPAILHCPSCGQQHVDRGKWARFDHRRHLCYGCGAFFEAAEPNVGVAALPTDPPQGDPGGL